MDSFDAIFNFGYHILVFCLLEPWLTDVSNYFAEHHLANKLSGSLLNEIDQSTNDRQRLTLKDWFTNCNNYLHISKELIFL